MNGSNLSGNSDLESKASRTAAELSRHICERPQVLCGPSLLTAPDALAIGQSMNYQSLDITGAGGCRECYEASWSGKKSTFAPVLVWARNILWNLQDTRMGIR